ncbi:hypothetical protein jhhlp_006560 [Lomentospora prolificans]|uniref:Uncharacterized protein n=1 Tax=Lomentospora prolificans TaxID=41688 RepID=A0A2N3N694_9PEZI|nr:hypothetical protein jhhlp_006560 [Lomentospora prolificans]
MLRLRNSALAGGYRASFLHTAIEVRHRCISSSAKWRTSPKSTSGAAGGGGGGGGSNAKLHPAAKRLERKRARERETEALKSSLAAMGETPDATLGETEYHAGLGLGEQGSESLEDAAGVVRSVLEGRDISVESLNGVEPPGLKPKRGRKPKGSGKEDKKGGKEEGEPKAKKKKTSKPKGDLEVHTVSAPNLKLSPIPQGTLKVPRLSYKLDRTLFKPGVYPLQDPRSLVYNFDPYLTTIMPIDKFDFSALKAFVSSSEDPQLIELAAKHNKKYSGSTSSMSTMLSHFHYLLSAWRPINPAHTSKGFVPESTNFTRLLRAPAATFLHWKNGTYAIDADKQFDTANILSMLGKSMEKLLTLPREEYELYSRSKSDQLTEEQKNGDEAFHYTTLGDFILRSQLDAHDPRLPNSGMFDIKTRAVLAIRMDAQDYHKGLGYEIRYKFGQFESFEREYFDMIRSAFLKYSLQVRMGRMDGIFVAYHNTQRIFGFQYIPLEEMDLALHGTQTVHLGDQEFRLSVHLLNKLLNRATAKFPNQSLRIHVETRPTNPPLLYFFAKPVTDERIQVAQKLRRSVVDKFEKDMMGIVRKEADLEEEEDDESLDTEYDEARYSDGLSLAVWTEMNQRAEEAVESDELGVGYVRRNIEEALEQSGLVEGKTPEEIQAYVDTLLETLTDNTASEETGLIEEQPETDVDEDVEEGEQSTAECTSETIASGEMKVETDVEDTSGVEVETTESVEESHMADKSTLKDLIMRLAEQVDDRPTLSPEEESMLEEQQTSKPSKLQKFERVLSELLVESSESATTTAHAPPDDSPPSSPSASSASSSSTASKPVSDAAAEAEAEVEVEMDDFDVEDNDELLGMILTVRNKVDGKYVTRPSFDSPVHRWSVEYSIQTMDPDRAQTLYRQVKERRRKILSVDKDRAKQWHIMYGRALPRLSKAGSQFRRKVEKETKGKPVFVVDSDDPMPWKEAFGDDGE